MSKASLKNTMLKVVLALGVASAISIPDISHASDWPKKPIRIILPVAAGGGADAVIRILQEPMSKALGQPVLVENKPGGGSVIGTEIGARAPADGYTLVAVYSAHTANPALMKNLPYDAIESFTPVAFIYRTPLAFAVPSDTSIMSLKDMLEESRKDPRKINVGVNGVGSANHLVVAQLGLASGAPLNVVGFQGSGPALNAALGGHVPVISAAVTTVLPHVKTGQLRALAVTSTERSAHLPDVPTVAELGFPGFQASEWLGIIGPRGLSEEIVTKLNKAVNEALRQPEIAAKLKLLGEPLPQTPAEFARMISTEVGKIGKIVRDGNIKLD